MQRYIKRIILVFGEKANKNNSVLVEDLKDENMLICPNNFNEVFASPSTDELKNLSTPQLLIKNDSIVLGFDSFFGTQLIKIGLEKGKLIFEDYGRTFRGCNKQRFLDDEVLTKKIIKSFKGSQYFGIGEAQELNDIFNVGARQKLKKLN